ncbi:MAG: polysaccharide deacetylase family protein [Oscillospiraceae bacterium]|nr:polysaccharide deacetylase family protein [Oscillospiraceae bacterium]
MKRKIATLLALCLFVMSAGTTYGVTPPPQAEAPDDETAALTPSQRIVFLTIDDGPGGHTHAILDVLDEFGVPATFFFLGQNYRANAGVMRRAIATGHGVHHHSWSHTVAQFYNRGPGGFMEEIDRTNDMLRGLVFARSRLIRVPFGSHPWFSPAATGYRSGLRNALNDNGFRFWDWNIDSNDWRYDANQVEAVAQNIIGPLRNHNWSRPANVLIHEYGWTPQLLRRVLPVILDELDAEMRVITNTCTPQNFQNDIN